MLNKNNTNFNNIDIKEYTKLKLQNEDLKRKNLFLTKEIQEFKGINWILSQVIKTSGTLDSFEKLMKNITDILMGILGVDTCTIWIKEDGEDKYITYSRSIYKGNTYEVKENEDLPDFLLKIKETSYFDTKDKNTEFCKGENVKSILIAPLEDFRSNNRLGIIIAEHRTKDFFTKTTREFFNILAIQISIAAINSKLFEKINEITNKDTLTNCYNRSYFEKLMLNMNTNQKNYSLAVFDLDKFKKVNDMFGHEKGDEILIKISNLAIKLAKKHKGEAIRFGGDEFILILFKPLNETVEILDRFRKNVPKLEAIKKIGIDITVTIGIASYSETVTEMKNIFTAADMALVQGKERGEKNTIHIGYDKT
ncbi:sensor domain-containing diguanylate cyclase [Tepidibacter formicigenes]|uniref:Diguanylate cyclase (GGDEF) domain-containing protein n=1 Tax=Tepidibacter formicigenes DSM 15518 TaxID=1123349 RepID=A0A1M6NMV5_9FIRM|nr:sensor domain-containing diguanylate cyclase [Tepidibacter formicigenes]SHJ97071.1 diguanylate cyclase (GGDEF) domain-containing protein [Tepidibacter formicigenes DSM 15518]